MGIKKLRKENNKVVKRRGVSKTLFAVQKKSYFAFSLINMHDLPAKNQ